MKKLGKPSHWFLTIITIILYVPIIIVVIYSFNESKLTSIWQGFSLTWYQTLFQDSELFDALKNSIILATTASINAAIIATLAAYGFTKVKLRSKSTIEFVSMLPIMIPEIILGIVLMTFFSFIGLPFGMLTLIIAHTTFCIPYIYMLVKARFVGIDANLMDAARDLGASESRAFFDIILPLLFPAIISGMLLSFAMSFDDVIISIFVTGVNVNTLPMKIYTQIKTGITPEINALCTLMLLVTVILMILAKIINTYSKKKTKNI